MQREQADPAGVVNRVLVRMVAVHRDFVGDIVDYDDAVEQHQRDKNKQD